VSPLGPHSYDPGISPALLFWTIPIPEDSVEVDLGAATAVLRLENVCEVFDAFTVPNSFNTLHPLGFVSGLVRSLRIQWSGITKLWTFDNGKNFRGSFIQSVEAPIEVTVTTPATKPPFTPSPQDGFAFTSDPKTTVTNWAQIGHEANGALY
jgi:hypothetical protein